MQAIKIFMTVIILSAILGCSDNGEKLAFSSDTQRFSAFDKAIDLSFQEMGIFDAYTPSIILPYDSIIFLVSTITTNQWLKVFSIPEGQVIKEQLTYGRGPEEALSAFSSGILNDSLWIHDITQSRLIKYNIEDLIIKESPPMKTYKMREFFYSTKMLNDSILVGSGMEATAHKLQFYNIYTGEIKNQGGTYDIPKNLPVNAAKDALRAYVNVRNSDDGLDIALTGRYSDVVELFDSKNPQSGFIIQGPLGFDPIFDIGNRDGIVFMKKRPDTRKAYVNSVATEKHIYALYSGGLRTEGRKWSEGQFIHVFDWEGNPKASYNIGQHIYGYGIDELKNRLYIYSEDHDKLLYVDL